jgi:hypothetical protein
VKLVDRLGVTADNLQIVARVGRWPLAYGIVAAVFMSGVGTACSSRAELSSSTQAGPNLSGANDLASFNTAINEYHGPFTVTTEGSPGFGSVQHFDGANYSLGGSGLPVDEYRIIADGPNRGPTCFITNDQGDKWVYESGAPMRDLARWSLGAAIPPMRPTGRFERTTTGFNYRDARPPTPQSVSHLVVELSGGTLSSATITDMAGNTTTQTYDFGAEPHVVQPRHASNDGVDITC